MSTTDEPEGWRLVPIEPTRQMCLADWNVTLSDAHTCWGVSECVWIAMLGAAPRYEAPNAETITDRAQQAPTPAFDHAHRDSWKYEAKCEPAAPAGEKS